MVLSGADEDEPPTAEAPRPASGHSKDGRADLKQVRRSVGVSGERGLPLRVGMREGNRRDRVETPVALEEWLALGLEGVRGLVAEALVGFQGRGFEDVVKPDFCDPTPP